jgi:hypothetical protein
MEEETMTARWTIRKAPGGAAAVVAATIRMLAGTAGATTLQDLLGPARTSAGVGFDFDPSFLNFGDGHDTVAPA